MSKYILKSVAQFIPLMFIISTIVFVLVYVSGDPIALMLPDDATAEDREELAKALGLDKPMYMQYLQFLGNVVQGDFGRSYYYSEPALSIVLERLPASLELALGSILITVLLAFPLGVLSALKRNSPVDLLITGLSVVGKAAPNFWVGIMLILLFAVELKWLPVSGRGGIAFVLLPAITLGTSLMAKLTRLIRSNLLEVLSQDYIRTARSKGLSERVVIWKHALRNALLPTITVLALDFAGLLGGVLITETIFAWPGMGQLVIHAVNKKDMAIVQAAVFVISVIVIVCNMIADILYRFVDPRIKFED